MAILRTIVWFSFFIGALICLLPAMYKARRMQQKKDPALEGYVNQRVQWWANTLLWLAGVSATVTGLEHIPAGTAVMFTPNHQGNYDIPLMLTKLDKPHALVAKVQTLKIPLVRSWMRLLDCVFLDRDNPRQAVSAMNEAAALMQNGKSVVVFPEGTRSKGGPLGEFKNGAFKMACKAGVPIVPVVIDGSYKIMEANGGLMRPAHVTITILPAIATAPLDRAAQKELPEQVRAQIAQVLAQTK